MDAILTDRQDIYDCLDGWGFEPIIMAVKVSDGYRYVLNGKTLTDKELDRFETVCLALEDTKKFSRLFTQARCLTLNQEALGGLLSDFRYTSEPSSQGMALKLAVDKAEPIKVYGLFPMGDASPELELYYTDGMPEGMDPGFENLKCHYRPYPGQLTVVTGIPGHGKGEMLDAILMKMSSRYDMRFAFYSPESHPISFHTIKLMEKFTAKPFRDGPTERMTMDEMKYARNWINERFFHIAPDKGTIEEILQVAKYAVIRHEISGLILDPWNQIEHCIPHNLNETQYISLVLTELREFAKRHNIHVWVVAHPTKVQDDKDTGRKKVPDAYSIAGSANWFNKADNILSIYRRFDEERPHDVEVHIQKIKFKNLGQIGVCFFRYDRVTGCYYPIKQEEGK